LEWQKIYNLKINIILTQISENFLFSIADLKQEISPENFQNFGSKFFLLEEVFPIMYFVKQGTKVQLMKLVP
jgi:hypothetical protein